MDHAPEARNKRVKDKETEWFGMMIPVRCFSCGKVIGGLYEQFQEKVKNGESAEKALDDLGLKRYCCRRMIFTQADLIEGLMKYEK